MYLVPHFTRVTWFFLYLSVFLSFIALGAVIYFPLGFIGIVGSWISLFTGVIIELIVMTWRSYHE